MLLADFEIKNASDADIEDPFLISMWTNGELTDTVTVFGLASNATQTLTANFGPEANCVDFICNVTVQVDADGDIFESNESNNADSATYERVG